MLVERAIKLGVKECIAMIGITNDPNGHPAASGQLYDKVIGDYKWIR